MIVFLLLFCLISHTYGYNELLLVVGTVNETSVRVLVDRVDPATQPSHAVASLFVAGSSSPHAAAEQNVTVRFADAPQILLFNDLQPATQYVAKFAFNDQNPLAQQTVHFSTLPRAHQTQFAFLSCSRGLHNNNKCTLLSFSVL